MTINTVNYPTPVTVNGFKCANCSEVDLAARHVDPQHPASGAYNVTASTDPSRSDADKARIVAGRKSAAADIPAYTGNGSHAPTTTVLGLAVDIHA